MAAESLTSFLESEAALVNEAAEALPHQFNHCTYPLGHLRQAVYLCLTCKVPRGLCSSCSVACHTDHEQVELFPKRTFRCDCPTGAVPHTCTLHTNEEATNADNIYGQNFEGKFCRCGRPYDAKTERETMIQCLYCEDWYHESCLNLRERPSESEEDPPATEADEVGSTTSSSGLPPPLISADDYESLICRACIQSNPTLRKYAGTKGALMVVRDQETAPWRVLDGDSEPDVDAVEAGMKRARRDLSPDTDTSHRKKTRLDNEQPSDSNICFAPSPHPIGQRIFDVVSVNSDYTQGAGDVFFTEGFRERWCRCDQCFPAVEKHPFLLEDEETYEPPEDPDSGISLEELGMRALLRLPRDKANDGIHAFNAMRDELMTYLRPFAIEGKVVSEQDVRNFFEEKMAAIRAARASAS